MPADAPTPDSTTRVCFGFHGCRLEVAHRLIGGEPFRISKSEWDWLGDGAYFWLDGPERAAAWARARYPAGEAAVVVADLDISQCLDVTRPAHQALLKAVHRRLQAEAKAVGYRLPENVDVAGDPHGDRKKRRLDRLVVNTACIQVELDAEASRQAGRKPEIEPFTSVRGVFQEGGPVYPGAGFHTSSHVQVAIRDPRLITHVRFA